MRARLKALLRQRDFLTLALAAIVVGSMWLFVELADELREGELKAIDQYLLELLRQPGNPAAPLGPPSLEGLMRDATALGSVLVLSLFTTIAVLVLWMERQRLAALWLAAAALGAGALNVLLKQLFARDRPSLLAPELLPTSFSFPSGHAFLAAAIYLTAGALLVQIIVRPATRAVVLAAAVLVVLLVGVTRVYLGLHYPSDVLAGWALGLCWAALCWAIFWNLGKRRRA